MPTRRPTPRRPPLTAPRGQLRAAYRLTAGMSRTNLARAENVTPAEIDQLLAQPDFQELLAALAEMEALPPEERLRQLERMAWCVLEMAVGQGDWRAAAFVADQMRRGCHPARSLAQAVLDAQARALAAEPRQARPPAPRPPLRPRRRRPRPRRLRPARHPRPRGGAHASARAAGGRAAAGRGTGPAGRQTPPPQPADRPPARRHRRPPCRWTRSRATCCAPGRRAHRPGPHATRRLRRTGSRSAGRRSCAHPAGPR